MVRFLAIGGPFSAKRKVSTEPGQLQFALVFRGGSNVRSADIKPANKEMMRRKDVAILAAILGYSVVCGSVLGALYIKATEPTSTAAAFWVDYVSLGVFPALVVFWLPRIPWIALPYVAGSLTVELVALHLVVGCFTAHDCVETTLAATAVPFVFLYCLVSMPVSIVVSTLIGRSGSSE